MPVIRITGFVGEQPRIIPSLLPDTAAQQVFNVRLDDGGLTPVRRSMQVATVAINDAQTIYKHDDVWLAWTDVVHVAPGPVATERLYITGDGAPKMRVGTTTYPLALAPPASALTATPSGSGTGDVISRAYVYTWVTDFGEESEPCATSNIVSWQDGITITLSGFAATPGGRNITKQRIYRSQTGQTGTYYYLIAERAATNADFVDTVAVDAFQEALPSADWNPPPDALEGIVSMPNGMMAAFVGRSVYFCEPYRPHAWPEKYVMTVSADIVALASIGGTLVVLTAAEPEIMSGSAPDSMQSEKLEQNLPCINGRGVVDVGFYALYPSHEGLVSIAPDGSAEVISRNLFSPTKWQQLSPKTMVASQLSGRYFAFYSATINDVLAEGALIITPSTDPFLIRSKAEAGAAFYDIKEGALYYNPAGTNKVMRYDDPEATRDFMYWLSKRFELPYPENFGVIKVLGNSALTAEEIAANDALIASAEAANAAMIASGDIGGDFADGEMDMLALNDDNLEVIPDLQGRVDVGVIADGVRVAQVSVLNKEVRLPSGFRATRYEIDVAGDASVTKIVLAKTMTDMQSAT